MVNPVPSANDRVENDVSGMVAPISEGNFDELTYVGDHQPNNIQPLHSLSGTSYEENRLASVADPTTTGTCRRVRRRRAFD